VLQLLNSLTYLDFEGLPPASSDVDIRACFKWIGALLILWFGCVQLFRKIICCIFLIPKNSAAALRHPPIIKGGSRRRPRPFSARRGVLQLIFPLFFAFIFRFLTSNLWPASIRSPSPDRPRPLQRSRSLGPLDTTRLPGRGLREPRFVVRFEDAPLHYAASAAPGRARVPCSHSSMQQ
jgi:hypothetical protein